MPTNAMVCEALHSVFGGLERFSAPFDINRAPKNGIYVLFERGETAHDGLDRIVRVGTHTGDNRLRKRISEHFLTENKDRSIFRKNIGRALLARSSDPFLDDWNIDLTTRAAKALHAARIDFNKMCAVEKEISVYMTNNFSFCVFEVSNQVERLRLESSIIGTINGCRLCNASTDWLGNHSPVKNIRNSGMWLVKGLDAPSLSADDLESLLHLIRR